MMLKQSLLISFLLVSIFIKAQTRDYTNWFDYGSGHISKWLMIAPAKLGPNALPVPRMNYGLLQTQHSLEIGTDAHFMTGDKALNTYVNLKWSVAPEKVMIEIWGNPTETFRTSNELRDERQIYYDDTGRITHQGDLWISTNIQLLTNRKNLPDIVLNYSVSTTTGINLQGRYIDAPISYLYLAFGKSFFMEDSFVDEIRIAGMGGWYIWQTNKVEMAQDEGPLVELGIQIKMKNACLIQEIGGYQGYDAYDFIGKRGYNDPLIYRSRLEYQLKKVLLKAEYQIGLKDYFYQTTRLSGTVSF